jgi:hypothetical protein
MEVRRSWPRGCCARIQRRRTTGAIGLQTRWAPAIALIQVAVPFFGVMTEVKQAEPVGDLLSRPRGVHWVPSQTSDKLWKVETQQNCFRLGWPLAFVILHTRVPALLNAAAPALCIKRYARRRFATAAHACTQRAYCTPHSCVHQRLHTGYAGCAVSKEQAAATGASNQASRPTESSLRAACSLRAVSTATLRHADSSRLRFSRRFLSLTAVLLCASRRSHQRCRWCCL